MSTRSELQAHLERIPLSRPVIGSKDFEYVNECLTTGWVSSAGEFEVFALLSHHGYRGDFILQPARAVNGDHVGLLCRCRDMSGEWMLGGSSLVDGRKA